ncbi:MAG: AEC family transporter [Hydrogenobacter sp.]|uniref:AEC family transporter n=1 Tax=Hydrogenobacter thermophilus TaxID=940 RepID=UPI0030F907C0
MLKVFLIIALGYFLRKSRVFKREDAKVFIDYVVYVALPAVSFKSAHSLGLGKNTVTVVILSWTGISVCILISYILGRIIKLRSGDLKTFVLVSSFGNTAFLGYPYTLSFFGEEGLKYAVIYDSLGSFLLISTVGFLISKGNVAFKELFTFPPFLGLMLGFTLKGYTLEPFIVEFLNTIASSLSPVVLFALGLSLSLSGIRRYLKLSLAALFIKMILSVLITYSISKLLSVESPILEVSLLEAGMPSMMMAGILALKYGLNYELAFASIGFGILLSFFTVPVLLHLL